MADSAPFQELSRWFARERGWINEQHLQLCRIPAPTFFEKKRAEWFRLQLEWLGWQAKLDRAGNVVASFGPSGIRKDLVVSAHLDTVFAPDRPEDISLGPDGRLLGPGVSDNGSGLATLLALAKILGAVDGFECIARSVLLVANVGEEGEGNLSGMRYLCQHSNEVVDASAFVVLDGPALDHITAQALASYRFEITFNGPGGHSWNDRGTPNPVHALAEVVSGFLKESDERPAKSNSSCNFSVIEGGSTVNSIPASARVKLDIRSEQPGVLEDLSALLASMVERTLERSNRTARRGKLTAKIRNLGARPGGRLRNDSPLLETIQAVDAFLNIASRVDCASTDANVPLSMGFPAISIGTGGQGGGAHTPKEWYHPDGREAGLRRVALLLSALNENSVPQS